MVTGLRSIHKIQWSLFPQWSLIVREEEASKPTHQTLREAISGTFQGENGFIVLTKNQEKKSPLSRAHEESKGEGTQASRELVALVEKRYDSIPNHNYSPSSSSFLERTSTPNCFLGRRGGGGSVTMEWMVIRVEN